MTVPSLRPGLRQQHVQIYAKIRLSLKKINKYNAASTQRKHNLTEFAKDVHHHLLCSSTFCLVLPYFTK